MAKTTLNQYDNSWYSPGGSVFKRMLWYFVNVIFFKNGWNPSSALKVGLLRWFGAKVGKGVMIKPGVNIKYPWFLEIGNYCWIGEEVWIDNLSQGAMLLTGNHNYKKSTFDLRVSQVTLEEGAWIGAKSIVCPGVTVHSHAVLSVGSVATADLSSYQIYQGNPAVFVRTRTVH